MYICLHLQLLNSRGIVETTAASQEPPSQPTETALPALGRSVPVDARVLAALPTQDSPRTPQAQRRGSWAVGPAPGNKPPVDCDGGKGAASGRARLPSCHLAVVIGVIPVYTDCGAEGPAGCTPPHSQRPGEGVGTNSADAPTGNWPCFDKDGP